MNILIVGAGGRLGAALLRAYQDKFEVTGLTHAQIDLGDHDELEEMLLRRKFDLLINCAAMTNVDLCEERPDDAYRINAGAVDFMTRICDEKNARLIHFSTDYVFDGKKGSPYTEEDEADPICVYGKSKLQGEQYVLGVHEHHLVVRVSWVFGPERRSFIDNLIQRALDHEQVEAVADKFSTPTYTHDIAEMLLRFLDAPVGGLLHFTNSGACSWQEYAQFTLERCMAAGLRLRTNKVVPITLADMKSFVADRPPYTVLATDKYTSLGGSPPRPWQEAVSEYVRDYCKPERFVVTA